jgi:tRNA A-37 threonylcarbamoyl transferase component Bud32
MTTASTCPQCGAELALDNPHGLCPGCLLEAALEDLSSAPTIGGESAATAVRGIRVRYVGDYELLEEVAQGGMGIIFKARQVGLNRIVALKMIRSGELASDADVRRFRLEAEAAANLQHPNIVAIHEVGAYEGHHYFTMDFVEGRNLAQVVNGTPLPARRAAGYTKVIADAIHFAHQRGTLHRDLKPQNVLIDEADRVRITDFGLAKLTRADTHLTMTGAVMGSPSYMPPEQARGRQDLEGPASDVYGIGAILYELLTGRPPFRGETAGATLMKVIEEDPIAPSTVNAAVPRDLETICLKCLEKNTDRRYPTARALAEDLARFLAGDPIMARPATAARKVVSWTRRHRWVIVAAASAAILALAALALGLWEETRYLRWVNAHPGWTRHPGALADAIKDNPAGALPFFVVALAALQLYRKRSRDLSWRDVREMAYLAPPHPIAAGWTAAFLATGLAIGGLSTWAAYRYIEAYVWENYVSVPRVFPLWLTFFFCALLVVTVVREQIMSALVPSQGNTPPPELARDSPIREALFAGRLSDAVRQYGEMAGLDATSAKRAVMQLAARLYRNEPAQFSRHPLLPPPLVPRRLVSGALTIVVALTAGLVLLVPEARRWPWAVLVLSNAAVGSAIAAIRATFSAWRRAGLILSAIVLQGASIGLVAAHDAHALALTPILLGIAAGFGLVEWAKGKR